MSNIDKDYGGWEPYFVCVDAYREEQGKHKLTTEQIAEACKVLDNVVRLRDRDEDIGLLPDRLIEAMMSKINDMDLLLDFITFEEHAKNHERIDTILKKRRIALGVREI